jgi:ribonuclease VapC
MVIDRRGNPEAVALVEGILERFAIVVEPMTVEHVTIARDAWRQFGKGSGHRAHLNFGDCLAYALAKSLREPLLFVGDDFTLTDL